MRMKICNKKPELPEMTLTIEYISKEDGMTYIRFDADREEKEERVSLFCHDDDTGAHDIIVSQEELKAKFTEIKRYMED